MRQPARKRGLIEQAAGPEFDFLLRWREVIDKVGGEGGQARVANRLKWSTSTVSRDYAGITLPSDKRLDELSDYLRLARDQRIELAVLLRRARDARQTRTKARPAEPSLDPDTGMSPLATPTVATSVAEKSALNHAEALLPGRKPARSGMSWRPGGRWIAAAVIAVAAAAAVLVWHPWNGARSGSPGIHDVLGAYPGDGLKAVTIPVISLTPPLAAAFSHGRTRGAAVTGYEFRNAEDNSLCLTAADTGPMAGKNGDRVEIAACALAADQIWIPEQWEIDGSTFTYLVSDEYQSLCLNADNRGGLRDGRRVQLWNCYRGNNESWDFGDWYRNVKSGVHSYPISLDKDRLCLDADRYDFGAGDAVIIWTQYSTATQFWS